MTALAVINCINHSEEKGEYMLEHPELFEDIPDPRCMCNNCLEKRTTRRKRIFLTFTQSKYL